VEAAKGGMKMAEESTQKGGAFIAKLLKRLGDEDWDKWMKQEMRAVDSSQARHEQFYANLLKKIEHEIDIMKRETR
jgi:hypothetical protein